MAPFLINHPRLIARWVEARELALAETLSTLATDLDTIARIQNLLARAKSHYQETPAYDETQRENLAQVVSEITELQGWINENSSLWKPCAFAERSKFN